MMQTAPNVKFRQVPATPALEADIRERIDKLGRYCPSIVSADVFVEPSEVHHRHGHHFHVRIVLTVPGEEIVVAHEPTLHATARVLAARSTRKRDEPDAEHKDVALAVRDAFAAARRRLQDYVRRQRGDVKVHAPRGLRV